MNTFQIMKAMLTEDSEPGTMGRSIDVNKCCELFVAIMYNLKDKDEAVASMNADEDVRRALLARNGIKELKAAGVLS